MGGLKVNRDQLMRLHPAAPYFIPFFFFVGVVVHKMEIAFSAKAKKIKRE